MCHLPNITMSDYQESDGQTPNTDGWTKWSLCAATLRRRHKNISRVQQHVNAHLYYRVNVQLMHYDILFTIYLVLPCFNHTLFLYKWEISCDLSFLILVTRSSRNTWQCWRQRKNFSKNDLWFVNTSSCHWEEATCISSGSFRSYDYSTGNVTSGVMVKRENFKIFAKPEFIWFDSSIKALMKFVKTKDIILLE